MKMRLRTKQILMFAVVIIPGTLAISLFMSLLFKDKVIEAAQQKLQSDMAMTHALLDEKYPGTWTIADGKMLKGSVVVNDNFEVVDPIGKLTGDTVTVFHGDTRISTNVLKADGNRAVGTKASDAVIQKVLKEEGVYVGKAEVAGVLNQTLYEPIKDASGKVIGILYVGVPNTPYENMATDFRNKTYLFGVVQIFLAFILAWFYSSTLSKNIRTLKQIAENITDGDLSAFATIKSNDEIQELGDSLNKMTTNLHDLINGISEIAHNLSASSQELTSNSVENASVAERMAKTVSKIAAGNDMQAKAIHEVSTVSQGISSSVEQLELTANRMVEMTANTSNATKDGVSAVEKAVQQMQNISASTESVNQAIQALNESSKQINEIATVISGIADQTNLLALNAAIEAARAGEAGRGFAVVAEEVRKLAEQSQSATQHISQLVNENRINIENANKAINSGSLDAKLGIEVASEARTAFAQVEKLANQVTGQIGEISQAIQQVSTGNGRAEIYIKEIVAVSDETALQAESTSESAREQLGMIQETANAANALSTMADDLQVHTDVFRL
jgi:methyl-accepting chemotaxis protein